MREDVIPTPIRLPSPNEMGEAPKKQKTRSGWMFFFAMLMIGCGSIVAAILSQSAAPDGINTDILVTIPSGSSIKEIATLLSQEHVIRSPLLFSILVKQSGRDRSLDAGTFLFKMPMDLFAVVDQLAAREHGIRTIKVTLREGLTNKEMSAIFAKEFSLFDATRFLDETKDREGYLFPDTYFFYANATTGPIISELDRNFTEKTAVLKAESATSGRKWADIITMASIIEEEAVTDSDRHIVSGILWERIRKGMRLQVDASFAYLLQKASSQVTTDDLNIDSPYNTYRYSGLPPAPIANPGLAAIDAALHPTKTPYLYYLSDKDGVMHYAKTFDEHKLNKAKYLR